VEFSTFMPTPSHGAIYARSSQTQIQTPGCWTPCCSLISINAGGLIPSTCSHVPLPHNSSISGGDTYSFQIPPISAPIRIESNLNRKPSLSFFWNSIVNCVFELASPPPANSAFNSPIRCRACSMELEEAPHHHKTYQLSSAIAASGSYKFDDDRHCANPCCRGHWGTPAGQ